MRVVFLLLKVASPQEYFKLLGDSSQYLGLNILFPELIKLIMSGSSSLAEKISFVPISGAQKSVEDFFNNLLGESVFFQIFGKIGHIILSILAQSVYSVLISLLLALAPLLLFFNFMLGMEEGLGAYFKTLFSLTLWPVVWNLIGLLGRELWPLMSNSPTSTVIFWVVIQALQLLSPVFCFILLKSFSPTQALASAKGLIR